MHRSLSVKSSRDVQYILLLPATPATKNPVNHHNFSQSKQAHVLKKRQFTVALPIRLLAPKTAV